MTAEAPPLSERVEVRVVAASPETARRVADVLRRFFACDEGRSYPADPEGTHTRLHLTLDASYVEDSTYAADLARATEPSYGACPVRPWIDTSRRPTDRTHPRETV